MKIDDSWSVAVACRGPVTGAALCWQRRGQQFLTTVAKLSVAYSPSGRLLPEEPSSLSEESSGLSVLAPRLPRCDVLVFGRDHASELRVSIERGGRCLFDKRAPVAHFAPIAVPPFWDRDGLELPDDHDFGVQQVAPVDQRIEYLQGDERIAIEGMIADPIVLRLPGIRPRMRLVSRAGSVVVHGQLDSLAIDLRSGTCTLLFRGAVPLSSMAILDNARVEMIAEEQAAPLSIKGQRELDGLYGTVPLDLEGAAGAGGEGPRFGSTAPVSGPLQETGDPVSNDGRAALPFGQGGEVSPPPLVGADVSLAGGTVSFVSGDTDPPLPFDGVRRPGGAVADRAASEGADAKRAEAERVASARAEAERGASERAEAERGASERAEAERAASERAEAEREAEAAAAERRRAELAEVEAKRAAQAAEERREQEAKRFAKEQREAADRERAAAVAKKAAKRKRVTTRQQRIYGFDNKE